MTGLPDADPPFFFRRVWTGSVDADEVVELRRGEDGTLTVTTGRPRDIPAHKSVMGREPDGSLVEVGVREVALPVLSIVPDGLVIYGRAVDSLYEADRAYVESVRAQGGVFCECFSVACVDGEVGTHPLAALSEISREEFEAARERGWE